MSPNQPKKKHTQKQNSNNKKNSSSPDKKKKLGNKSRQRRSAGTPEISPRTVSGKQVFVSLQSVNGAPSGSIRTEGKTQTRDGKRERTVRSKNTDCDFSTRRLPNFA
ncbi:hypothetical protein GWI33_011812 [Rhynchophorus ferrugineus]|uniref:Uncharacterized protein n=1 Tax=Rhynchophorus ferrugineus TaxID=354439 RepID=A0A834IAE0_RHYFE|nr:hypothetical protein GWI33_011812 [Rhynchophorus ferrugineus]